MTCSHVDSGGTIADTNSLRAQFIPTGDKGDTGPTGPAGPTGSGTFTEFDSFTTTASGRAVQPPGRGCKYRTGSPKLRLWSWSTARWSETLLSTHELTFGYTPPAGQTVKTLVVEGVTVSTGVWSSGSGAPSGGSDGDMYLDSATGDVYGPKTAGVWGSSIANIKGATGDAGNGDWKEWTLVEAFDGARTTFTTQVDGGDATLPGTTQSELFVGGVFQDDFSIGPDNITLGFAPESGESYSLRSATAFESGTVSDGTITQAKRASEASQGAQVFQAGGTPGFLALSDGHVARRKGTSIQSLFTREVLTADTTYYVRKDGSDSNDGTADNSGGAWLTIQHGLDWIAHNIDQGEYAVILQVRAGTYTENLYYQPCRVLGSGHTHY